MFFVGFILDFVIFIRRGKEQMKEKLTALLKHKLHSSLNYIKTFLKWFFCSCVVGVLCGFVGAAFHMCVAYATEMRQEYSLLLLFLPVGGLIIVWLYQYFHMLNEGDTNLVIRSIRSSEHVPIAMAPLIFVSTVITHLLGGSAGREGAALQIGGSMGAQIGRLFRLDEKDLHVITMCGMSAVFSALFGTPLTAAIFAMEVISVGVIYYTAIIPCIIAAIIGYMISNFLHVFPESFAFLEAPALTLVSAGQVIALAALCAVLSILFCMIMRGVGHLYRHFLPNPYLRIVVGGLIVVGLTFLVGTTDYNGAGMNIISHAITGHARPEAFALKILFTALTLEAGFKGGEIVPTFFIGSTFGCVMGGLLGLNPSFGAAIGLVSLFCGVVNCPITSMFLSMELFGSHGMLLFGLACGVSYMLSGYYGLYSSQKIVYSKLRTEFINQDTK